MSQLPGSGDFSFPIVGESYHQAALEAICGLRKKEGERKIVEAVLVLENNNPHDKLAVRVEINGQTVGHLSRSDARHYRAQYSHLAWASCRAIIKGGWQRGPDRGHYGVNLDLSLKQSSSLSKKWLFIGGSAAVIMILCLACCTFTQVLQILDY